MTRAEIEAILAGTKGVTPGPWTVGSWRDYVYSIAGENKWEPICRVQRNGDEATDDNQDVIDAAHIARLDPQTVSALCTALLESMDRVEAQGRERKALEASLTNMPRSYDTEYDGRTYTNCTGCERCTSEGEEHEPDCIWLTIPDPPPFEPGSTSAKTVPCPDCARKFHTDDDLRRHRRDKHARKSLGGSNGGR